MPDRTLRLTLTLKFLLGTGVVLGLTLSILFYVLVQRQERLIQKQVENEARIIFRLIVLTRGWFADHRGVFVEKLPWMKSETAAEEIIDRSGKRYIRKSPAIVTKELSEHAKQRGMYWFHLTSLTPINPDNAPDDFETSSIRDFQHRNVSELSKVETINSARYFRYIAPLRVEPACLECHGMQGFRVGDVGGAISITIPMEEVIVQLRSNRINMFVVAVLTTILLLTVLYIMMARMVVLPVHRIKSSIRAFARGVHAPGDIVKTGDELEELGISFSEMAQTVSQYHQNLEEQIKNATKDLEGTNQKLTEANLQLTELNLKKSDFVAKASHELRTPLTSIKGAMDYLSVQLRSIADSAGTTEADLVARLHDLLAFFEIIKKNAERLIRLVNDLLDLERIEQGRAGMHFTEADLPMLISETVTALRSSAEQRDIAIQVDAREAIRVHADEDRVRQVLFNLLSNALKFSPAHAAVLISATCDDSSARIAVTDSGPGIPEKEQQEIFERFHTRGDKRGTGLGLAISKGIVEAHGGTLTVASDGKKGTSFSFTLPLSREGSREPENPGH